MEPNRLQKESMQGARRIIAHRSKWPCYDSGRAEGSDVRVKRIAIIVLGGGAVAAGFAGAATSNRPLPDPAPLARAPVDARGEELANEIARLQERLKPTATPRTPGRNLFTYRAAAAPIAAAPPSEPRAAIVDIAAPAPAL